MPLVHKPKPVDLSDEGKTREQLLSELRELRAHGASLEEAKSEQRRVEEVLRASEELYRRLFETMQEHFSIMEVITDEQGRPVDYRFLDVNPALERYSGNSREQFVGRTHSDFMAAGGGDAEQKWFDIICRVGLTGNAESGENYAVSTGRWAQYYAFSPRQGKCAVISMDITEHKKAEEALQVSEARFRSVLDNSLDVIYRLNVQTSCYEYISPSAEMVVGFSPDELMAQDVETGLAMIHPEDLPAMRAALAHLEDAGKGMAEYRQRTKSGDYRWISNHMSLTMDSTGRPLYRNGNIRDITERKQAEEEHRKSEEVARRRADELEKLMDLVPMAIFLSPDPECRIITGNKAMNRLFEVEAGENVSAGLASGVEQNTKRRIFKDGRELRPEELPMQKAVANGIDVSASELDVLLPSGRWKTVLGNASPLLDDHGQVRGGLGVFVDITGRKQAEEELKEAKMQAEMYLDLMGHDINNLNQIALGYLELASNSLDINSESGKLITRPIDALHKSSKLIENVKKIQKLKSGTMEQTRIDIGNAIEEAVNIFAHMPDRDITVNYIPVEGWYVKADELLKDVFDNLLVNAVKHSPCNKPLIIDIELADIRDNGRNSYRVTVADNGTGIPDNKKSSIFGRFSKDYQLTRGSGLGLYVTKTLVERYGGSVWVENRVPGDHTKGAKFMVMLPAA
jgi:PAS domain S-box-containing protein